MCVPLRDCQVEGWFRQTGPLTNLDDVLEFSNED